jgi:hypothetical protein
MTSCSSLDLLGYKNLGNHYYLWEGDHYNYYIIWNPNEKRAKTGGAEIIEHVFKYDFNKDFIIAKTTEYKSSKDSINKFWIIDKRKPTKSDTEKWKDDLLTGPLDSIGLINYLKQMKIELKLKNVPAH